MNTILPIGSVVKLNGLEKNVMIFGYLQKIGVSHVQKVDYIGVPYPEGNVGPQVQIGFQRADIEEVIFEGYRAEEFEPWAELIRKYSNDGFNNKAQENAD